MTNSHVAKRMLFHCSSNAVSLGIECCFIGTCSGYKKFGKSVSKILPKMQAAAKAHTGI